MARRWRWSGALMTTALAVGLVADPAAAKITFSGISDVRLGMSEEEVRAELGAPSATSTSRNRGASVLHYRRQKLEVTIESALSRVVAIKTRSLAQRTSSDLGVGSREADVRRKLRGENCSSALGTLVCSLERGGAVLDFEIPRGRVTRVSLTRAGAR
jgi:hypothetical protein